MGKKEQKKDLLKGSQNITTQLTQISKTSDLLKCKPVSEQILKFGRDDVNNEVAKSVMKCAIGLGIELSNYESQVLIEDIIEKYKFDSIEDIQVCLKKGRQGNYGSTYGKLNMIIISDWMSKHLEEKYRIKDQQIETSKKETDFEGWATREEYEKAAKKPTPKSVKDVLREQDEDYQKYKAEYYAKKQKK